MDREKIPRLFLNLVNTLLLAARYQRLVHVTYTVVQIPGAKKVAFLLRDFPVDIFTLQDMLFNDRVFYYGSRSGLHLYSLKIVNSAHDGSWAIGASLGDYLPVWLNPNCKAAKDPGNGSCTYGWHSAVQNRFKSNQITSVSCNEFD